MSQIRFPKIKLNLILTKENPLYVGHFFKLERSWYRKREDRQNLILSIAAAWYRVTRNSNIAFLREFECYITSVTAGDIEARECVLERFFKIRKLGYSFDKGTSSPSILIPKKLGNGMLDAIEQLLTSADKTTFDPGEQPSIGVLSTVKIQPEVATSVHALLKETGRLDLAPQVNWLLSQNGDIQFHFKPAGTIQARDTSIWPVRAIETWPSQVRHTLFGTAVDIDAAFVQFLNLSLKDHLDQAFMDRYLSDIVNLYKDKDMVRNELLNTMGLERTDDNLKFIKKVIMSVANGSNITRGLLAQEDCSPKVNHSKVCELIVEHFKTSGVKLNVDIVGKRLHRLSRQFRSAKKQYVLCVLKRAPTRVNIRRVFKDYLRWERESRYNIWNACGKRGLHLHDGIDAAPTIPNLQEHVLNTTGIKVTVKPPLISF